jgi:hypothetical protein
MVATIIDICHATPFPNYIERLREAAPLLSHPPIPSSLMALTSLVLCAFALALPSYGKPAVFETENSLDFLCTCNEIAAAISDASQVFFPRMSHSHQYTSF